MGNNKEKESGFAFKRLPVDSERTVNDKELLTFTNLTNLKWEFLDVFDKDNEDILAESVSASTRLSEVLKDPKRFVREDKENKYGDNVSYIYGKRDKNGEYLEETGIKELRRNAGIAMEYLEKDEGEFLNNPVAMT